MPIFTKVSAKVIKSLGAMIIQENEGTWEETWYLESEECTKICFIIL